MADRPDRPDNDDTEEPFDLLGAAAPLPATDVDAEDKPRKERRRWVPRLSGGVVAAIAIGAVLLLALVPAAASPFKKTPRDKVGLSYGGGPFEAAQYQRTVQPGSGLFFNGVFDKLFLYPADQVNYIIARAQAEGEPRPGTDTIIAPTMDRVQVEFEVANYFKLNTDLLRDFHEQLGLRYSAYTSDGWDQLIQDTFRQHIVSTLQEEVRRMNVSDLYSNADQITALKERVQATLAERLRTALGDDFFCSPTFEPGGDCEPPTFVITSVQIPENVRKAYESNRTSQVQVQTRRNEVEQRKAEAEGIQAISDALAAAGDDYVLLKAIESGKISFWVLPSDAGVTLTTPNLPAEEEGAGGAPAPAPPASGGG